MNKSILILGLLLTFSILKTNAQYKKGLKLLHKEQYAKVEKTLNRAIKKDTANAGAKYIYSLLYLNHTFNRYNLDSSYLMINQAIANFPLSSKKQIKSLKKARITDSLLLSQKVLIDSLAFQAALESNSVSGFEQFLAKFPTAKEIPKSKVLRNQLAFDNARTSNTFQAYQTFFKKYPNAAQVNKAKERYNELLFESKTKDKSLASYQQFLEDFPNTPFRNVVEKNIFQISTANNQESSFYSFIKQYPKSKYAEIAGHFLLHRYKEKNDTLANFISEYPAIINKTELQSIIIQSSNTYYPYYENNHFGMMSEYGETTISAKYFEEVGANHLCYGSKDFIHVKSNDRDGIANQSGTIIYQGNFDKVDDIGHGLLNIKKGEKSGIIHKSGFEITELIYDDVAIFSDLFIKVKKEKQWGLITITGKEIFKPKFQDILSENGFIMLQKDDKYAITNEEELLKIINAKPIQINYTYDDYALINEQHLLVEKDNTEGIINGELKFTIPLSTHKIYDIKNSWLIKKDGLFSLYNQNMEVIATGDYKDATFNNGWVGLKKDSLWSLYSADNQLITELKYDSIKLINKDFAVITKQENEVIVFSNNQQVPLKIGSNVKLMTPPFSKKHNQDDLLLIQTPRKKWDVYNRLGKRLFSTKNKVTGMITDDTFIIEKSRKKGLINAQGKTILLPHYDAISLEKNGDFTLLEYKKFGIFNPPKKQKIDPFFASRMKRYSESIFIGNRKGKEGFVTPRNRRISNFIFEEIEYWSDSIALVKKDNQWQVYNIYSKEVIMDNILDIKIVANNALSKEAIILAKTGYGVINNITGTIINPEFTDIVKIGDDKNYIYFCEQRRKGDDFPVVSYINRKGKVIRKQVLSSEDYDKIYCDE